MRPCRWKARWRARQGRFRARGRPLFVNRMGSGGFRRSHHATTALMPRNLVIIDQLKRQAQGLAACVRPHHLATAAVVAAIGLGVAGLRAVPLPEAEPILEDERIRVEVVDPVEPNIAPGAVMDVGDLVDGFVFTPPPRPAAELAVRVSHEEDFEYPAPRSVPREYAEQVIIQAPPQPETRAHVPRVSRDERAGRWFGFDAPDRDYRAERDARRAHRDAAWEREREREWGRDRYRDRDRDRYRDREQDQDRREVRRYISNGSAERQY